MLTITLRLHPSEVLNANQRMHWAVRARLTDSLRTKAALAWRTAGAPQMSRAHCTATITYPDRRKRDAHNLVLTCKALVDGLVHPHPRVRGLLPDDNDDYLTGPDLRFGGITRGLYTIRLDFKEL